MSYAPFRRPGQTPFDPDLIIPAAQIREDLTALAGISRCIRLYSVGQGLEQVPGIARELGLKVLLGAWIGFDPVHNQRQLDQAIALANQYQDVVAMLIVGNEVLLRRERTPAQMRSLLEQAQTRTAVPVSYADVWEFWVEHAELAEVVDQVTVHILPFWENDPVDVKIAIEHVVSAYETVDALFDKPVLIGETGWPSAGRQREASRPSRVNQARFMREFVHHAHQQGWQYNLIEAIDQPWKRALEGTVGGHWGLLDVDLNAKFPFSGPVRERESMSGLLLALAMGAIAMVSAGSIARPRPGPGKIVTWSVMGGSMGLLIALQWEHAVLAYRTPFEWTVLGTVMGLGVLLTVASARRDDHTPAPSAAAAWRAVRIGIRQRVPPQFVAYYALLRFLLLFAAAIAALLLFADPRYRDFPTLLYLLPALGVAGFMRLDQDCVGLEEKVCAIVILVCVIGRWLPEITNPQAIAWSMTGLLLASGMLIRSAREHQQR